MPAVSLAHRTQRGGRPRAVIAMGASAGGLESLGRILAGLPEKLPATILIVLRLDSHYHTKIVRLLQHRTKLRVRTARAAIQPKAGTVYVAPPDNHLEISAGKLRLTRAARLNGSRPSFDRLFTSVATDCGPKGIAAVLGGTGSDGAAGLVAVKTRGGVALAEKVFSARYPDMAAAAVSTGLLDAVLPAGKIPAFLIRAVDLGVAVSDPEWDSMMGLLQARTGATFSGYRSSTLLRRLQYRIAATGCGTMASYLRRLKEDFTELDRLQAAFLIKVSSFFRDRESWTALADQVTNIASHRTGEIRAWSAGCATGEEAYTMALLLARVLGGGPSAHWKVFATDLDEGALKTARRARYTEEQLVRVTKRDLSRYFVRDGDSWRVDKLLRSRVVFGKHDLLNDPPLLGMDVVACRNVLIYLAPDERKRIVRRLSFSVNPGGVFFLGRTEALAQVPGFRRLGETTLFQRTGSRSMKPPKPAAESVGGSHLAPADLGSLVEESPSIVAVAIDAHGGVVLWNRAAEDFFGKLAEHAMGRRLATVVGRQVWRQLTVIMHSVPGTQLVRIEGGGSNDPRELLLECLPATRPAAVIFIGMARALADASASRGGASLVSVRSRATDEARLLAHQDLTAQLQSRNEELETMNEEMISLNDELAATEVDLRDLAEKSQESNEFLRRVIDAAVRPFVACDSRNMVILWNSAAVKWFGLSAEQAIGRKLFELVPALDRAPVRAAFRKGRQPGKSHRWTFKVRSVPYMIDAIPEPSGERHTYLVRIGAVQLGIR